MLPLILLVTGLLMTVASGHAARAAITTARGSHFFSRAAPGAVMVNEAFCGPDGRKVRYTRHQIWAGCFMPLGGKSEPRPGELNAEKIAGFIAEHLYFFERWFAPTAQDIVTRCDSKPSDGWLTQEEFESCLNPDCLGDADAMCHVKDVCDRELRDFYANRDE